jgi:hypothetical protein
MGNCIPQAGAASGGRPWSGPQPVAESEFQLGGGRGPSLLSETHLRVWRDADIVSRSREKVSMGGSSLAVVGNAFGPYPSQLMGQVSGTDALKLAKDASRSVPSRQAGVFTRIALPPFRETNMGGRVGVVLRVRCLAVVIGP